MSALIITFLKENTLGLYAYVRTEMSAWGFQNTPFLWILDLKIHSPVVYKHFIYCAEWVSTKVLLSTLSLLPTAFNGIYENSQWITPWAYNKATSNKRSEQYETKSRNTINVTFSSLCFASSFAVGFTGLPLGRRKITLSFWNGRIIVRHMYARLTSGVYRLPKELNQSEPISLFLTLFTQKSVHDAFSCSVTPTTSVISSLCRQSLLEEQPHAEKIKPQRAGKTPRWHPCVHFVPKRGTKPRGMERHCYHSLQVSPVQQQTTKPSRLQGDTIFSPGFPEHLNHRVTGIYTAKPLQC